MTDPDDTIVCDECQDGRYGCGECHRNIVRLTMEAASLRAKLARIDPVLEAALSVSGPGDIAIDAIDKLDVAVDAYRRDIEHAFKLCPTCGTTDKITCSDGFHAGQGFEGSLRASAKEATRQYDDDPEAKAWVDD